EPLLKTQSDAFGVNQPLPTNELHYFYKRNIAVGATQLLPPCLYSGLHFLAVPSPKPGSCRRRRPAFKSTLERSLNTRNKGRVHGFELRARPKAVAQIGVKVRKR